MDVSVIIPTYNRLWCLPQAIASCRDSTCRTEIIVVDDGSTDGTWEWLQTQPDVVKLRQENWGKTWAVNRGFEHANGKYVRFLDSDDWLSPGTLDRQFQQAEASGADVVVAGYEAYSESGTLLHTSPWEECDDFIAQQLGECSSSHYSAYLFRRAFIADIPHRPDFAQRDDRLFVLEVAMAHPKVVVDDRPAFCHRHHGKVRLQATQGLNAVATHWQHLQLYRKCLARLEQAGELTPRRGRAAAKILWHLAHWIAYTHLEEGVAVAQWVYELDRHFQPPERGMLGQMYRTLGFRRTEQVLQLRRELLAKMQLRRLQPFKPASA
ncbi:MAG TPA: glycosyltransferase family 2 protein [Stenomitos sp.]